MFNGKKYNFILIFMIIIMSVFVAGSVFVSNQGENQSESENPIDVIVPVDVQPEDEGEQPEIEDAPKFSNGFEAINYGLNILNNGKGFYSVFSQTIKATVGVTVTQNIKILRYRGNGLDFTEEFYYSSFSYGANEYKSYYSDGTDMKIFQTDKNYNYSTMDYNPADLVVEESFTADYYENTMNRNKLNDFFQTINSGTSKLIYFDKSHKDYYSVKISVKKEKINPTYISTFEANGAIVRDFKSLILTFKIDKKTGYLMSVGKEETVDVSYMGIFSGVCNITCTEQFIGMNKSYEQTIKSTLENYPS